MIRLLEIHISLLVLISRDFIIVRAVAVGENSTQVFNGLCDPRSYKESVDNETDVYYECTTNADWNGVGEWTKKECASGLEFNKLLQKCEKAKSVRRQNLCNRGTCNNQPLPCASAGQAAFVRAPCNWLTSPLTPDPFSSSFFLQCIPASLTATCGVWQRMPCPVGTQFQPGIRICVLATPTTNSCPPRISAPVCPCSGGYNACPATCSCHQGTCCRPVLPVIPPTLPPIQPTLPPPPPPTVQVVIPVTIPLPVCPTGQQASFPCSDVYQCPGLTYCVHGYCCPMPICPNRLPATQYCDAVTPCLAPGYLCLGNGCCPGQPLCPLGGKALSPCAGPGSCGPGLYCFIDINRELGCCPIPVCPTGQPAVVSCDGAPTRCPPGTVCINAGCCPIPSCPNGAPGLSGCLGYGQSTCPPGFSCENSVCCPNPVCGDGQSPVRSCNYGQCMGGGVCNGDTCCPLPLCPDGELALVSCYGSGQATCPLGYQCFGRGCCPLPSCPDGTIGIQSCNSYGLSTCPLNYECVNEVCCRSEATNRCPNGGLGGSYCLEPDQCGPGYECVRGTCCFLARCPDGQLPAQPCGEYGQCGIGFFCIQGQCCQQTLPICPNGQRAAQMCLGFGQGTCAYGFQCVNGGCCPVAIISPISVCPAPQQPVCFCAAYNYACPSSTSCHSGSCCATQSSPLFNTVRPGTRCLSQDQCPGQFSACINGYCSCIGSSRSNGVTCVPFTRRHRFQPGETCDQFASNCTIFEHDSTIRQLPVDLSMRTLGIHSDDEPLFWYSLTSGNHYCNTSRDCTPDMTCLKNKCYAYMVPGDRGCVFNEQCSFTAPGSICMHDEALNTTLCRCNPPLLQYARKCVAQCPSEAKEDGFACTKVLSNSRQRLSEHLRAHEDALPPNDRHRPSSNSGSPDLKKVAEKIAHLFGGKQSATAT